MSLLAEADRFRAFALRELRTRPGSTIASVVVMAISSAFLVAMIGISGSVAGTVRLLTESVAGNAAIEVSGLTDSGLDEGLQQTIASVPGVEVAAPVLRAQVATPAGTVMLVGADFAITGLDSRLITAAQPHLAALISSPGSVLVGPALGQGPGDAVQVAGRSLPVAAVIVGDDAMRINSGYFMVAPLTVAQDISGRAGRLDSVMVVLQAGAEPTAVRNAITEAVRGRAVVNDSVQHAAQTSQGVVILEYLTLMSAAVAFVVAAFLVYTVMSIAISRRRSTLATLRALGGNPSTLVTNLLGESAVLGLIGGALGAAIGVAIGRVAVDALPAALVQSMNLRLEYSLPVYATPLAVLMSMAMTVAAALVAAYQVYKVSPLEAMIPVEVRFDSGPPPWLRSLALIVAVLLIIGAILIHAAGTTVLVLSAAALAMVFAAGGALCLSLAGALVAAIAAVARVLGSSGRLAAAAVERSPLRVWATLMTVVIAVAMTVTITGANSDTIAAAKRSLSSYQKATLFISSNPPSELPTGSPLPDRLAGEIAGVPGVAHVVQGRMAFSSINGARVALNGLAAGTSSPVLDAVRPELRAALLAGDGVVLSEGLGELLGISAGDGLALPTPGGIRAVQVLQLIPYLSVVNGVIGMSLEQMRSWFDLPGSSLLEVYAAPDADRNSLAAAIRELIPSGSHLFTGTEALSVGVDGALRQVTAIANSMWVIVVVIAAVALLNTLTMSVLERRRELGVLRAIGAERPLLLRMVMAEAASIGAVGAAAGVALGLAAQWVFDLGTPGILNFEVAYRPQTATVGFAVFATALCLLGCLPPAVRAARINILQAIGTE